MKLLCKEARTFSKRSSDVAVITVHGGLELRDGPMI